jgi:hypothetical protein
VGPLDHLDAESGTHDEACAGCGALVDLRARDDRPDAHRAPVPGSPLDGSERTGSVDRDLDQLDPAARERVDRAGDVPTVVEPHDPDQLARPEHGRRRVAHCTRA